MTGRYSLVGIVVAVLVLSTATAQADELDSVIVEPTWAAGVLVGIIDLTNLISAERVARLKAGVDLLIEVSVQLDRPKRLWGHTTVASSECQRLIGYRYSGQDFVVLSYVGSDTLHSYCSSLAHLHRYLADSIRLPLYPPDTLSRQVGYRLSGLGEAVWMTSLNRASAPSDQISESNPVRYLFEQFLRLTSYGRIRFESESDIFLLSDVVKEE